MEKITNEINAKSKQANELLRLKNDANAHKLLKEIFTEIKKNPILILHINDYESLAYSFLLMYIDKTETQNELKKIIELAYVFVTLAINKNNSKPYNLRIAILKHGEKIFQEDIINIWELKKTSSFYQMIAIMIFNNLLITDIVNTSSTYLAQPFFKKINQQLDEAISSGIFDPIYSKIELAKRGFGIHKTLFENLNKE